MSQFEYFYFSQVGAMKEKPDAPKLGQVERSWEGSFFSTHSPSLRAIAWPQ